VWLRLTGSGEVMPLMSTDSEVFINTRSRTAGIRGVQRYTAELQQRFTNRLRVVAPSKPMQGVKGHIWEQAVLPRIVGKGFLWSPANTGPLTIRNQVLTVHDIASLEHPEWFNSLFAAWYRWLIPELVKRVRRVITGSRFSRERLLDFVGVEGSKVVVVPEGVDGRFHPRTDEEIMDVRAELRIPSPYYVLSLGALEPRKNLCRLLAAWSSCKERLPDEIWLVVAGARAPENVFGRLEIDEIPAQVHFTGFVPDASLPALYSGALALVYVSVYEGFGLPALEAMASGTVPIVADNSSLPEVVGDAGIPVDPYNIEAIAAAIERLIEDSALREALEARAVERSRQFSWDRSADLTWGILTDAMRS
jgi:glycosyltransferase involved in cell wall biosynthesis